MQPFWTYMLRCHDRSYYVGHTDDLELRMGQHNEGRIPGYTFTRLPVEMVWCEQFPTRVEALEMERRIKGWTRKKKEALIHGDWAEISRLSRGKIDAKRPRPAHGSTGSPRTGVVGRALAQNSRSTPFNHCSLPVLELILSTG